MSQYKTLSKVLTATAFVASSTMVALAHPGHIEAVSGHAHWLSLVAAGAAIALLVGGLLMRKRKLSKAKN